MRTILIVEDERDLAFALAVRLRSHGYEALMTHDAMMGVTMAVRDRPDLILLDIAMPAGGGFAVAERLRNNAHTASVPIIFITASKQPETKARALSFNPVGFFEKPFDSELLVGMIDAALGESPVAG